MATANFTKPSEKTAEVFPTKPIHLFKWTPDNYPQGTDPHVCKLGRLVDRVIDIASGASMVFALMVSRDCEIDSDDVSYLNANHMSKLQRLAMSALEQLEVEADEIALSLHNLARGEK